MYKRTRIIAILPYILICVLSLWLLSPLFRAGFFEAHDAFGHLFHMIEINACLQHGILYPRWFPDIYWGYGGPIMTFYPSFFYFSVLPLYLLTQSYFLSFKLAIGLAVILSGFLMYAFARIYWGKGGALLAAVAYMYAPHHIVDLYVRGAFPEACLYVLLPALLLLVYKTATTGGRGWAALLALGLGISFMTHILSVFFPPVLAIYALLLIGRGNWRKAVPLAACLLLAIGMTAIYWLPAVLQKSLTHIMEIAPGQYNWRSHFVYPLQLLSTAWGFGDSLPGPDDGMSFQIGLAHIAFFILSLISLPWLTPGQRRVTIFSQVMVLLSIFMLLPCSAPLWSGLPFLNMLQFPWRLLFFTNVFTSFLAGAALRAFGRKTGMPYKAMATIGIIISLFLYGRYCRAIYPNEIFPAESDCTRARVLEKQLGWHVLQYLPTWVRQFPEALPEEKAVLEGDGTIEELTAEPDRLSFSYSSPEETRCIVNTYYYPCWECRIDGRSHPLQPREPRGEILILLPAGKHHVTLRFADPPSVTLARIISLASLIITVVWPCWGRVGRQKYSRNVRLQEGRE